MVLLKVTEMVKCMLYTRLCYIMCILYTRLKYKLGGGNANPIQYSCQENPMDRGAWWATVHTVAKSQTHQVTEHTTNHIKS